MNLRDDYIEGMAEELLTDMADRFFSKRRGLEDTIQTLESYVAALKKKKRQVDRRARFLSLLLTGRETARKFYREIGGDPETYALPPELSDGALPPYLSPALTAKGEYLKLVFRAYERLQESVDGYLYGVTDTDGQNRLPENIEAHYTLIEKMCDLVNEQIETVNREMPPGRILDCFRRFDPAMDEKCYITGGGSDYSDECTLNRRMAFKTLDMHSFELVKLPDLPPINNVRPVISNFCKKLFREETHKIHEVMNTVKHRLKTLQAEREEDAPKET